VENETTAIRGIGRGMGFGRGKGGGGGQGFAFRGSSPPWPYVGRGRGGKPRCAYYTSGANATTDAALTADTGGEELQGLRRQSESLASQLEQIKAKIDILENEEKKSGQNQD